MPGNNGLTFSFFGEPKGRMAEFADEIHAYLVERGDRWVEVQEGPQLVYHFIPKLIDVEPELPIFSHLETGWSEVMPFLTGIRPLPRSDDRVTWSYSVAMMEGTGCPGATNSTLSLVFPRQFRALAPTGTLIHFDTPEAHVTNLEQGHFVVSSENGSLRTLAANHHERIRGRALARYIWRSRFVPELPRSLWEGDATTRLMKKAGQIMASWGIMMAPYPVAEILPPKILEVLKDRLEIGGLSWGNLSARADDGAIWMSATGVDKRNLEIISKDIVLVTGYDESTSERIVVVPPHVKRPSSPSVDAIEHWMLYTNHPQIGAIIHIHGWMEGVAETEIDWPCGTIELAEAVDDLVRRAPDPSRAVVGLKNHGLTITGRDINEILKRVEGKILPEVPMS